MSPSPTSIRKEKQSLKAPMLFLPLQYLSALQWDRELLRISPGLYKEGVSMAMAENHRCPINGLISCSQATEYPVSQITSQSMSASLGWGWPGLVGVDEPPTSILSSTDFLA